MTVKIKHYAALWDNCTNICVIIGIHFLLASVTVLQNTTDCTLLYEESNLSLTLKFDHNLQSTL